MNYTKKACKKVMAVMSMFVMALTVVGGAFGTAAITNVSAASDSTTTETVATTTGTINAKTKVSTKTLKAADASDDDDADPDAQESGATTKKITINITGGGSVVLNFKSTGHDGGTAGEYPEVIEDDEDKKLPFYFKDTSLL